MRPVHVLLTSILLVAATLTANAQSADEIVTRHIEAVGGKDAWKKITSLSIDGVLNVQGNDIEISLLQLHGKGMRQNITVQGLSGYQIVTPTQGWTFLPFQGMTDVVAMSEDDVRRAQSDLDVQGPLLDYQEKGHAVELAGTETIDGTECHKLAVTFNSGKRATMFIDSKTYFTVRTTVSQKVNGQEQDMEMNYSEFQKTPEGVVIPRSVSLPYGTMTVSRIAVNKPVDETVFKPVDNQR